MDRAMNILAFIRRLSWPVTVFDVVLVDVA
jgi:hypothetical protein